MGKGSLHKKYTGKLGEKSKPLLVPPSPFKLGTLNSYLFIGYLDCHDIYGMNKHANLVQAITFQDNNLLTVEWTNHWHLVISYF